MSADATTAPTSAALEEVLRSGALRSVFQPIVDLATGAVVAHEALVRGPAGPLERPDQLFAAARAGGRLAELDAACRLTAFRAAVSHRLFDPLTLFVNVEPEVLESAPLDDLLAVVSEAAGDLRVVLEITERSIAARPAHLLATVDRVRALGWGVALDDVGADSLSLAFMPLLRPDVVKLDLRLVQERPGPAVAEIMNAVNAYAERTGALLLAEGIEDERHLHVARALGATLGQGWMFGRPQAEPAAGSAVRALALPPAPLAPEPSPFACLPPGTELRQGPKGLLIELSKQLEREAMRIGETCVVAAAFQDAQFFTPATTGRYRDLADRVGFVCAIGEGLPDVPVPGVRGADLAPSDPARGEWDVAVLGPHFAAALLARDLGDTGPDRERCFEFALTYDRDTVQAAARALVSRIVAPVSRPGDATGGGPAPAATAAPAGAAAVSRLLGALPAGPRTREALLQRALAASSSGITICDARLPDQPLVYVNPAFEALSGFPAAEVLGRNCRFLQGADTEAAAVARLRRALRRGEECTETLLNHRGPERTPWWNEVHLSPVTEPDGTVVAYIGVQTDVTARVKAERALRLERDRARGYLEMIEQLARTDSLTGLLNRRSMEDDLALALWEARGRGDAVAFLFVDLDGFRGVNDRHGHAAGDEVLRAVAQRLRRQVRRGDLVARSGGDEFLVALTGLDPASAAEDAAHAVGAIAAAVRAPVEVDPAAGTRVVVEASIGVGLHPREGDDFAALHQVADERMHAQKHARQRR